MRHVSYGVLPLGEGESAVLSDGVVATCVEWDQPRKVWFISYLCGISFAYLDRMPWEPFWRVRFGNSTEAAWMGPNPAEFQFVSEALEEALAWVRGGGAVYHAIRRGA